MVRAAIPHIGVRRIACGLSATDAEHCGAASPRPLFQAPGHDAGQRQEWKYTGTRGSRLTHRFAICPIRGAGVASARSRCALWRRFRPVATCALRSVAFCTSLSGTRIARRIGYSTVRNGGRGRGCERRRPLRTRAVRKTGLPNAIRATWRRSGPIAMRVPLVAYASILAFARECGAESDSLTDGHQNTPSASPAAIPAPISAQRARSSLSIVFGARMRSGVCAWVQTIRPGATFLSRHPVAIRSIWRSAF